MEDRPPGALLKLNIRFIKPGPVVTEVDAGAASTYSGGGGGWGRRPGVGYSLKEGGSCKSCRSDLPLKNSFPCHQNTRNGRLVTSRRPQELFGGKPSPTSRSSAVLQIGPYPPFTEHDRRTVPVPVLIQGKDKQKHRLPLQSAALWVPSGERAAN